MRALWITRFSFSSQEQLEGILDRAAAAGFNTVLVQIRGNGDAYYASTLEPWAQGLTGQLGRDPGWDPLAVAVAHGHALGLQVHAYFNVFSAWPKSLPAPAAEGDVPHMLEAHPEWTALDDSGEPADSEYLWVSPGHPDVRAHTVAVARDLLTRYDVDGLHLDRVRSPGPTYSHDARTLEELAAAQALDPALTHPAFMTASVNATVAALYDAVLELRPTAALSAAVWGIHTALPGCNTSEGKPDYHQDSWAWAEGGFIDALVPMAYWDIEDGACTDWSALLDDFLAHTGDRALWMGMHALDDGAFDIDRIAARVALARARGAAGTAVFASAYLDTEAGWDALRGTPEAPGPFLQDAVVPALTWR